MFNKKELNSIKSALEYSHERAIAATDVMRKDGYVDKDIIELMVQATNDRRRLIEKIDRLVKELEVVPG